jgi:hypothetical protein
MGKSVTFRLIFYYLKLIFQADFPSGQVNQRQLAELFKRVFPRSVCQFCQSFCQLYMVTSTGHSVLLALQSFFWLSTRRYVNHSEDQNQVFASYVYL